MLDPALLGEMGESLAVSGPPRKAVPAKAEHIEDQCLVGVSAAVGESEWRGLVVGSGAGRVIGGGGG